MTQENLSLSLFGYSSTPWSFSELRWRDSRICLVYTGTGSCSTADNDDTSARLGGVGVGGDNTTMVHFIIPTIQANESGTWNITMYRNPTNPEADSRSLSTVVTQAATVLLSLISGEVESVNSSWVRATPGSSLSLVCQSLHSRPEVTQFLWDLGDHEDPGVWANTDYSNVTYYGRDSLCSSAQPCRSGQVSLSNV